MGEQKSNEYNSNQFIITQSKTSHNLQKKNINNRNESHKFTEITQQNTFTQSLNEIVPAYYVG